MWGEKRFYSLDYFYRQKFGTKVARVTIDGGFTCPNRDGTVSSGGCLFCGAAGAGDFCAEKSLSVSEQIEVQKSVLCNKWKELKIIPYFQSFTNTYAATDILRQKYEEAFPNAELVVVEGADHSFSRHKDKLVELVVDGQGIGREVQLVAGDRVLASGFHSVCSFLCSGLIRRFRFRRQRPRRSAALPSEP